MTDLTTKIKNLTFKNPVTVASGTFGTKDEFTRFVDYEKLGAIITKTITVNPRIGNPMPRICETASGMLNAIGLQNKGLADFIENKIPYFSKIKTPLIVNIAGETTEEFSLLAKTLEKHSDVVQAIEINLSCPNVEKGGSSFMRKRERMVDIIKAVRAESSRVLFAKISPELGDVLSIADDVLDNGADGLSIMNTLKGLAVDIWTRKSRIANVTGGLSGPAIKPIALRYVYETRKRFEAPIIASGGISTGNDAVEFLIVGATLVAVGTASFVNPSSAMTVAKGIEDYMQKQKISSLDELRGSFYHLKN